MLLLVLLEAPFSVELSMEPTITRAITMVTIHVVEEEDKQKMAPTLNSSISAEVAVVIVVESEDRPLVRMSQAPDSLDWKICLEEVATTIVAVIAVVITTTHPTTIPQITIPPTATAATINNNASATTI